ncbi:acetyl transferase [Roseivivax halodurans JCM 10272]|uniref:Acetyl transferase n=1 Tax=Roseivivax halodurans JCM 10272 TaxID=1449350 RepID=X7EGT0_9RHOB|nr:GNAT family N-acetyltransferase [Roseivivax halodurans]ETX15304.1 acetyl transferase [Roseivivax halodurans JCM 10272]
MPITIRPVSPQTPEALALLDASHALMRSLFPVHENHMLDPEALAAPGVSFYGAEAEGALLGCVALKRHADFAEVKSLYVAPEARGLGIGAQLLDHVEAEAGRAGLMIMRLETGDKLLAATALYDRCGYVPCDAFGDYPAGGSSVFYEKALAPLDQGVQQPSVMSESPVSGRV